MIELFQPVSETYLCGSYGIFFKVLILSYCCSGDEYLWGWVATRGNLPLLHHPNCGSGAGDVFPSWNEGRKTSRVSCWYHLVQGSLFALLVLLSILVLLSFLHIIQKSEIECMVNTSLTRWWWKYKINTWREKCFATWVSVGQERSVHEMKQPALFLPLLMMQKVVAARVLMEGEVLSWAHWAGFLLLLLTPGMISPLWYLSHSVCSGLSWHTV